MPSVRGGRAQRDDLGVRRRVLAQLALVVAGADHLAAAHDDRADRHVVVVERPPRLAQRQPHELLVAREQRGLHARPRLAEPVADRRRIDHGSELGRCSGCPATSARRQCSTGAHATTPASACPPLSPRSPPSGSPRSPRRPRRPSTSPARWSSATRARRRGARPRRERSDRARASCRARAAARARGAGRGALRRRAGRAERDAELHRARAASSPTTRAARARPAAGRRCSGTSPGRSASTRPPPGTTSPSSGAPAAAGVIVAVLDTGVAYSDRGRFTRSPDLRGDRFARGYDFVDDDPLPATTSTATARTSPRRSPRASTTASASPGSPSAPRSCPSACSTATARATARRSRAGIRFAAKHGADVINLSFEFDARVDGARRSRTSSTRCATRAARARWWSARRATRRARPSPTRPARHDVLSVGATTEHGCLADYSNNGPTLDLVAPGGGAGRAARRRPQLPPARRARARHRADDVQAADGRSSGSRAATRARRWRRRTCPAPPRWSSPPACSARDPTPAAIEARLKATARDLGAPGPGQPLRRRPDRRRGRDAAPPRAAPRAARPDDQHRAGRVVGDLVGHGAEQEALGAGHALVADDDQVGAALLGDVEDRVRRVALARVGADLDAGARGASAASASVASTSSRGLIIHCRSRGTSRASSRSRAPHRLVGADELERRAAQRARARPRRRPPCARYPSRRCRRRSRRTRRDHTSLHDRDPRADQHADHDVHLHPDPEGRHGRPG